jgi:hypothetical protein
MASSKAVFNLAPSVNGSRGPTQLLPPSVDRKHTQAASSDLSAALVSRRTRFWRDKLQRSPTSGRTLSTYNVAYETVQVDLDVENFVEVYNRAYFDAYEIMGLQSEYKSL